MIFGLSLAASLVAATALLDWMRSAGFHAAGIVAIALLAAPLAWAVGQLAAHARTVCREATLRVQRETRCQEWLAHLWQVAPVPPLDVAGKDALADLIEVTSGGVAAELQALYVKHGFLQEDIDVVISHDRAMRLRALARLARVRHQGAMRALLLAVEGSDASTAREAWRALARTIAYSRGNVAVDQFVSALHARELPDPAVELLLRLTGERAEEVTMALLGAEDDRYHLVAVRAIGRLRLHRLAPRLEPYLVEGVDASMRAAAFTSLAEVGMTPAGLEGIIAAALTSPDEIVRAAAARAAKRPAHASVEPTEQPMGIEGAMEDRMLGPAWETLPSQRQPRGDLGLDAYERLEAVGRV